MARLNYAHASFRAVVASDLTGLWGDTTTPEFIFVNIDGNGQLIASPIGDAIGFIDCTEGKKDPTVANFNVATAGSVRTVLVQAELTDANDRTAGQELWVDAAGDIATTAPATVQKVGVVVEKENGVVSTWLNV